MLLLAVEPSGRLAAQGVLNQFSYDNLRLSGVQLDAGLLGASDLTGTTVGGLRLDYGRIAPRVRLVLGLSYFRSEFDQQARNRFQQRLRSVIIDPTGDDTIKVGRISLSDLIGDVDFQFVFPQGHGVTAYLGTGVSVHVRRGSGPAINGTFVQDALDVVTAGLNGTMGFTAVRSTARNATNAIMATRPGPIVVGDSQPFSGPIDKPKTAAVQTNVASTAPVASSFIRSFWVSRSAARAR